MKAYLPLILGALLTVQSHPLAAGEFRLDEAVEAAGAAAIVRIRSVSAGRVYPAVMFKLKGQPPISFVHPASGASPHRAGNALQQKAYQQNRRYIILFKEMDGEFRHLSPRDQPILWNAHALLHRRDLPEDASDLEKVVENLCALVECGFQGAGPAIAALASSRSLPGDNRFEEHRNRLKHPLLDIMAEANNPSFPDACRLLAVLNEPAVIPCIVRFACSGNDTAGRRRTAIHWLRHFPFETRRDALAEIAEKSPHIVISELARAELRRADSGESAGKSTEGETGGNMPAPPPQTPHEEQQTPPAPQPPPHPQMVQREPEYIRELLGKPVTHSFVAAPLSEAAGALKATHGLQIDVLKGGKEPVTLYVRSIPLGEAVWWIARLADLKAGIGGSRVTIGSNAAAATRLEIALKSSQGVLESRSRTKKGLALRFDFHLRAVPVSEAAGFICRAAGIHVFIDPGIYTLKGDRTVTMVQKDLSVTEAVEMMAKAGGVEAGLTHSAVFLTTRGRLEELGVKPLSEELRNYR